MQPAISVMPSIVNFGNVVVGNTSAQTITLSNTGTATLSISQVITTGAGFSVSGVTLPMNISVGNTGTLTLNFAPAAAGGVTGTLTIISNAPNSPLQIPITGSGVAATLTLSVNPSTLSFGDTTVGQRRLQSVTLTNTGNSPVTVSQVTVSGAGFSVSGIVTPLTLSAGQNAILNVTFSPASTGSVTGALTVTSNATGSPFSIALSGNGVQAVAHSVDLSWDASTSPTVVGYNVYRSTVSGGTYSLLTSSLVAGLTYTDSSVLSGQTYYYVATAVDAAGIESIYSNEVQAVIPPP